MQLLPHCFPRILGGERQTGQTKQPPRSRADPKASQEELAVSTAQRSGFLVEGFGDGLLLAALVAVQLYTADASAAEVCRFAGTTDFAGQVAVTTDVASEDDVTKVDVTVTFESTTMFWPRIRYLVEEVSTWQTGELQGVAVNSRYLVGDHIVRQQWDDFQRGTNGLQAYRVQAKTLADFRSKHPGFVQHWDP